MRNRTFHVQALLASMLFLVLGFASAPVLADDEAQPQVEVVEPFLELRTGPGSGYPVVRVVEQGEWIELHRRKTTWIQVRDSRGREGWAREEDIERTRDGSGQLVKFDRPQFDDFRTRRWEGGLLFGDFEGAAVTSVYLGYWLTENFSGEVSASQALGDFSETLLFNANIVHQPFPSWRVSPYFTLGTGTIFVNPKSSLVNTESRNEDAVHWGTGVRWYLSDRYFLRLEYKDYLIFTPRERNEEAEEWKLGLSVFF